MSNYITQEEKIGAHNYLPLPVVIAKAKDVWMWDTTGNKYLDMMSSYSAVSHGHCNERLLKVLEKQASTLCNTSRAFHHDKMLPFFDLLSQITKLPRVLPMNTGAEAVETAIKAARRWGYQKKGIPTNQAEIIVAENNFHGRTTTIISFSTEDEYKKDFGPFTPGFKAVEFNNVAAIEAAITPNTAAILIEPMQGEAGILIPDEGYLQKVRELCDKHNVLLILDEIQVGLGRTGKNFAFEHEGIMPDGLILGKALGGGILPISAFCSTDEVMSVFDPGSHGSTFGGNPLATAVATEALQIMLTDNYAERSARLGAWLLKTLKSIDSPAIKDVRGKGLWIGVDFNPNFYSGHDVCLKLMEAGFLTKEAHNTVVRLAPPLTIDQETCQWAADTFKQVIGDMDDIKETQKQS